jgi:DNA processing protein
VPYRDPGYPRSLLALADPPPVLFLRGDPGLLDRRSVAIVGSRRATPIGRRVAERFGRELSQAGIGVVSGLAFGIDAAAHRGALDGPGGTIAVLGSGPDRSYPRSQAPLFDRIVNEGLVVSEFPPGERARPHHFPRRNRVLAALSRAVVVVEAAARSGALITVDHALDLGLEVFAVPGSVETPQAAGVHSLLKDGAHLMTTSADLFGVMGWTDPSDSIVEGATDGEADPGWEDEGRAVGEGRTVVASGAPGTRSPRGSPTERARVLAALSEEPAPIDRIVETTGLAVSRVLAVLTRLEADGACRRDLIGWMSEARTGAGRRATQGRR